MEGFTPQNIDEYLTSFSDALRNEFKKNRIPPKLLKVLCFGGVVITHLNTIMNIPDSIQIRKMTRDIDVKLLNEFGLSERPKTPITQAFLTARESIARQFDLPYDWINDAGAIYVESYAPNPPMIPWRDYGNNIRFYFPTIEYQFVLKVLAGRLKDQPDIETLCQVLNIERQQRSVRQIIKKYITHPRLYQEFEVEERLKRFFTN